MKSWYNVGQNVKEATNSTEAMNIAGLNWEVESQQIFFGQNKEEAKGFIANVKNGNIVLGIVSDVYKIIQNSEAFSFADEISEIKYEEAGQIAAGKKVWLSAGYRDADILGQKLINKIFFSNNHDGKGSIRISIVPIMESTGAPLNLPLKKSRAWSTTHSGDTKKKIAQAKETLSFSEDYLTALINEAKKLSEMKMTEKQMDAFVEQLFPIMPEDGDRKIDNIKELRETLKKEIGKIDFYQGTAWQAINGVAAYIGNLEAKRASDNFEENKFNRIIGGDWLLDKAYKIVKIKRAVNPEDQLENIA